MTRQARRLLSTTFWATKRTTYTCCLAPKMGRWISVDVLPHGTLRYTWAEYRSGQWMLGPIFPGIGFPIIKIRRSWDRLIFIKGIPILVRQRLPIETPPWSPTSFPWRLTDKPADERCSGDISYFLYVRHCHDDVMTWKYFPRHRPSSSQEGPTITRRALKFSLLWAWMIE